MHLYNTFIQSAAQSASHSTIHTHIQTFWLSVLPKDTSGQEELGI